MKKNDLRFIKTEDNLKEALLYLLESQSIEKITIKALCDRARCSRNAFYQHYETKYDLYNAVLTNILGVIRSSSEPIRMEQGVFDEKDMQEYTYRLLKVLYEHRKELQSLRNGNDAFTIFLSSSLYQSILQHDLLLFEQDRITDQVKLMNKYLCWGITGFIEQWLSDDRINLQEAQQILDTCTRDNMRKLQERLN